IYSGCRQGQGQRCSEHDKDHGRAESFLLARPKLSTADRVGNTAQDRCTAILALIGTERTRDHDTTIAEAVTILGDELDDLCRLLFLWDFVVMRRPAGRCSLASGNGRLASRQG